MAKGRPGGNPDLEKYQFQKIYEWDEPCTSRITLRVPPSMKDELQKIDGWPEIVRRAIAAEIEKTHTKN